ncbi:MAG TPA: M3 family metallopeptidase [Rubrivivax sp.]
MTPDDTNPLLRARDLPDYAAIRPEHIAPAMEQLLATANAAVERAVGPEVTADYEALSAVLDVATERLERAWGAVGNLNAVVNTPELRAAYNGSLGAVTEFYTRLGADERLFAKYRAVAETSPGLSAARRRALDNALRDFVLAGAELQGERKQRFARIRERRAELSQRFAEHVLDATDGFTLDLDEHQIDGLPADAQAAARAAAQEAGQPGYRLTLQAPSYQPAMLYLRDRALREALHNAYVSRASELGPAALDNSEVLREQLALRQEEAQLLGYASAAELSLVPKMANSSAQVIAFLRDLAHRARPHALRELAEVQRFASCELGLPDLQAWDLAFASERLKEAQFAYSAQELKAYFTLPRVLEGLFHIIETLFDVRVQEDSAAAWHESVRFFRVERRAAAAGDTPPETVAHFYLDLHARTGKRPGAWMGGARSRWLRPDTTAPAQTPVAILVCNFAAAQAGKPALLTHADLITLFHEFGHGLHHMLTAVEDLGVSGISGVEWDAVELPSQFMENFCWEWDVLRGMTAHVDTGEPLPRALFDKMVAARNFQSALATLRQVEMGLFDMRLHAEPGSESRVQQIADEVRAEVSVLPVSPHNRFAHAFAHIFAGGYAAGYYSYKWAEVLSADAWSAFEAAGTLDVDTGRRYRREILEAGGSRPAIDSFRAFRGREPTIDALLRHRGMS